MSATHFQDFVRDNGLPVTVEYEVDGSYSAPSYSPHSGADSGDAPNYTIIRAWPNTPGHERLARLLLRRPLLGLRGLTWAYRTLMRLDEWWRASLTPAEYERFEAWLAEHHVEEDPCDPEDYL
jgi:hypothetical protein